MEWGRGKDRGLIDIVCSVVGGPCGGVRRHVVVMVTLSRRQPNALILENEL